MRSIQGADESIRIQIENESDFSLFKQKVLESCSIGDARANLQMQRIAHDTDLTKHLDTEEKEAFLTAAYKLYPSIEQPEDSLLLENVRFEFSKINAAGESLVVQLLELESFDDVYSKLSELWTLLDERLLETNSRELAHMQYIRTLDMNTQIKIGKILDILYGRTFKDEVAKILESEAKAKSKAKS